MLRGSLPDDRVSVGSWLLTWLAEKTRPSGVSSVGRTLRPSTARMYHQHVHAYLIPQIGGIRLNSLRPEHISAAYEHVLTHPLRPQTPMRPATLRRVHATLRAALNDAVKARLLERNPAVFVTLPDVHRPPVTPWSAQELGAFLDQTATHRLAVLYEIIALTGLRRGEALGLRWSDVDLAQQILTVRQQLIQIGSTMQFGRPKTASGEDRVVDLDDITTAALHAHLRTQGREKAEAFGAYQDQDPVFAREDGTPLSPEIVTKTFTRLTNTIRFPDDAHLPEAQRRRLRHIRLHDLRHGQASLMLAAGVPMAGRFQAVGSLHDGPDRRHLQPPAGRRRARRRHPSDRIGTAQCGCVAVAP